MFCSKTNTEAHVPVCFVLRHTEAYRPHVLFFWQSEAYESVWLKTNEAYVSVGFVLKQNEAHR